MNIFYCISLKYVLGAQKNCLIKTVLLSTHNICFGGEVRKIFFKYTILSRGLHVLLKTCQAANAISFW